MVWSDKSIRVPLLSKNRLVYTEKIDFKTFMKGNTPERKTSRENLIKNRSFSISPLLFIDPTFLGIGLGIVAIALVEKAFANSDHLSVAALIASFLEMSFPLIGFGAAMYFISKFMFML